MTLLHNRRAIASTALAGLMVLSGCKPSSSNTADQAQIDQLQADSAAQKARLDQLQTDSAAHEAQLGTLQSTIASQQTQVSALQTSSTANEQQLGALRDTTTTHESQITDARSRLDGLEAGAHCAGAPLNCSDVSRLYTFNAYDGTTSALDVFTGRAGVVELDSGDEGASQLSADNSQIRFNAGGSTESFEVGFQGGEMGALVDLGTAGDLDNRYGPPVSDGGSVPWASTQRAPPSPTAPPCCTSGMGMSHCREPRSTSHRRCSALPRPT